MELVTGGSVFSPQSRCLPIELVVCGLRSWKLRKLRSFLCCQLSSSWICVSHECVSAGLSSRTHACLRNMLNL